MFTVIWVDFCMREFRAKVALELQQNFVKVKSIDKITLSVTRHNNINDLLFLFCFQTKSHLLTVIMGTFLNFILNGSISLKL